MFAHELAKKLLEMPDEEVFVDTETKLGSYMVRDVRLCNCECEIFIYLEYLGEDRKKKFEENMTE